MHPLDRINRMDRLAFVDAFGAVYEHSPWVAEGAYASRPFETRAALVAAMQAIVTASKREAQLALIRAHPELAGQEAVAGRLGAHSSSEQTRLGIHALSRAEFERMTDLNRRYRERHGFPCIIALKLHASRASVFAEFERRIGNDTAQEIALALEQIGHIARGRLENMVRPVAEA
ncbi:MAG: 2-oxo-4-hydroxy-4-carboxy-5-ureidoimidazoline decarboxylase [Betaproteobacteria bacterium]|nr:2-oxo-4-hydroxy-4-carboxy-5-ureidoimidazoline decarboxylase [Betaproteobacteria bacterium]